MTIGVLALQGDFEAHRSSLSRAGAISERVRTPEELDHVDGLIIPGGESTTLLKLARELDLMAAIRSFHDSGRPVFGTCAGAILIASKVRNPRQECLGLIDIDVARNGFGRQKESFEVEILVDLGERDGSVPPALTRGLFIRAPRIERCGQGVEVLARLGREPVLVRQGPALASTFHPEMGLDPLIHAHFARMVSKGAVVA